MPTRRTALGLLGAALAARGAAAQGFPSRPVRILIPYPPGGGTDALVRPFSERFRLRLGQPVVIENRGGAATNIGMEAAARSAPDGHTLIVNADNVAYFPFLYRSLPYDLFRDFAPVGYMAETPLVIAVNPAVPAATLEDFVALAKASPDRFSFANPSVGSPHHLGFELFAREAGIRMVQAQYRGGGPATNDVIAGHVHMGVFSLGSVSRHFAAGTLKPYALLSPRRSAIAPDIPTTAEAGLPRAVNALRFLLLAPAGTPREVVATLHAAMAATLAEPELVAQLTAAGFEITVSTPEEAAAALRAERDRWAPILPGLNLDLG
ncbi:Bug family tripartite tricarboxylate transporter substrate binding protein [Neoroseomonas rubea]|uniref:Bug family tripartite tricarboxylate transporter substrate binding protein n=1 Tax=Neoroseomonas rubea TaxID=2748666 RepID=UPI0018DF2B13|nr:tripartite tricarboxylate transporter substrate-binding protein [Roseomonas rubea]